ncbi:hypothetical protein EMIHUDRAFT_236932 [Emiliania huxleyi CCMP1516]|uniref:At4g15545-like C-terminal domain-containing protein n=2 Tax=Emiliania huxleyi TaxID=2903 RepID=A0A0D3JRU0_EMIH1|nr:hypothetical protein EMIHUDRAFT_236932 [Emiliania huxleyi CCMP1516]EOD26225.1 hypothetical protein EMIHUDRAFT_236932 [Emiliania huxleyi CCMP1516]|eukprot:XP_005778654.1 hypothetical protein EMIHUDRAFT_236932 [Emiliania huxleyi CCMP1516]
MATLSPDPLPSEPGELLKLGLSLIERAYDERARGLEAETARLRAFSAESEGRVTALQQRVSELEAQLRSGAAENASLVSERASLAAEKNSLAAENRSLQERLDKAGQFKRAIMSIAATNGQRRVAALSGLRIVWRGLGSIHGQEFFRAARLRLSYEQFSAFLASIKRLNDHAQTREETVSQAGAIFGTEHRDLWLAFQGLLNRHGLT